MTDEIQAATPPQDSGPPDPVERDGLAIGGAEDLDEDRMRVDPLEAGMDPPERWMGADRYGVTPYEQTHDRPLSQRLAEEQPDVQPDTVAGFEPADDEPPPDEPPGEQPGDQDVRIGPEDDLDAAVLAEASRRGQAADEAGGSVASAFRTPAPAD